LSVGGGVIVSFYLFMSRCRGSGVDGWLTLGVG